MLRPTFDWTSKIWLSNLLEMPSRCLRFRLAQTMDHGFHLGRIDRENPGDMLDMESWGYFGGYDDIMVSI